MITGLRRPEYNRRAFAVKDLCFTLVGLFILAVLTIPMTFEHKKAAVRINCVNNLKQVALGFRIWSGDNDDRYPMAVFTNDQGGPLYASTDSMFRYFQVMSNEFPTPKILICPQDWERNPATNFGTGFSSQNTSYFIGLEAVESNTNMFLSGDRSLSNGNLLSNGTMLLSSNQPAFWWPTKVHDGHGNVALTDGSVAQLDNPRLSAALAHTGVGVTYLVFP